VLLGGDDQWIVAEKLVKNADSPNIINLTGNPLLELTAVLKAAAAAVGTPYVTLFGPTPAGRHVPYGCEHLIVQSDLHCAPCYQKQCPEGRVRCMENIEVRDVVEKISRALNGAEGLKRDNDIRQRK
jgi:ADP-heptose:LPS heptosyltransferase